MIVDLGDGRVVDFGNLPQDQVEQLVAKEHATQEPPGAKRELAIAGSSVVSGLDKLLGAPGDLESLAMRGLSHFDPSYANEPRVFPTSSELLGWTNQLGLTNRPELQPKGWEQYMSRGIEGLASALPISAFGPRGLGMILTNLAAGGGAGLASQYLENNFPNRPGWLEPTVGAAIGLGLGTGRNMLSAGGPPWGHSVAGGMAGSAVGEIGDWLLGGHMHPMVAGSFGEIAGMALPYLGQNLRRPGELTPIVSGVLGARSDSETK